MPASEKLGRAATATGRGAVSATRHAAVGGRWFGRTAGLVRSRVGGGEAGMIRLFDLHAISAAGDTLITVGLAGTIFFAVPLGEARGNVALYLLVTMVPFALLSPLIGPLLDHFRHGRRYALAATMLGRAVLAWLAASSLDDLWLYPAAFGVLVLSRAYGVARAAAVPRLLPERLQLSLINARGSVYGTLAGLVVLPLGVVAFWFGPQWPLRVASLIFLVGMVIALRLPARADSDQPESPPHLLGWLRRGSRSERALSGRLVVSALIGSAIHRALYGFLLIFLAFSIRASELPDQMLWFSLSEEMSLGLVSGALVAGTFLAVAAGSRLRIRRPIAVQAVGLAVVAVIGVLATVRYALPVVVLLCLLAAVSSGLAKLTVDSTIQEKIPERLRATAFAHSETTLMLAFVAGAAIGLIPMPGRVGVGIVAGLLVLAMVRAAMLAVVLRRDQLSGRPPTVAPDGAPEPDGASQPDGASEPDGAPQPAPDAAPEPAPEASTSTAAPEQPAPEASTVAVPQPATEAAPAGSPEPAAAPDAANPGARE